MAIFYFIEFVVIVGMYIVAGLIGTVLLTIKMFIATTVITIKLIHSVIMLERRFWSFVRGEQKLREARQSLANNNL